MSAVVGALSERRFGDIRPDIMTLHTEQAGKDSGAYDGGEGDRGSRLIAAVETPPQVRFLREADMEVAFHVERQRALVIRKAIRQK